MNQLVAVLDTLVNLVMLLGVSFFIGFIRPYGWRKIGLLIGLTWGLMPALVSFLTIPLLGPLLGFLAEGGLYQLELWPASDWMFLFLAWPLLMLAVGALGGFLGARIRVLFFIAPGER